MIRQIFLNLYIACLRKSSKVSLVNASYCRNMPLPSVVISPWIIVLECEPVYVKNARIPFLV